MSDGDRPGPRGEPAPPSLRERKRAQTRQAILEACAEIELFHGGAVDPERLTYARIAEVAGVSERTVYRFFPTKQDLDAAYLAEQPIGLGLPRPASLEEYADMIEQVTARWSERMEHVRIAEQEVGTDDYPLGIEDRRRRDRELVEGLAGLVRGADDLPERQLLALAAAVNSTVSVRILALSAQRWNLTLEEAGRAHAWAMRTLLHHLAEDGAPPWEEPPS